MPLNYGSSPYTVGAPSPGTKDITQSAGDPAPREAMSPASASLLQMIGEQLLGHPPRTDEELNYLYEVIMRLQGGSQEPQSAPPSQPQAIQRFMNS